MEKIVDVCFQLGQMAADGPVLRDFVAESARKLFAATLAGVLAKTGESYVLLAASSTVKEGASKTALMSHAKSFASQAIEQNRAINFRFSYRDSEGEKIYYGVAMPLGSLVKSSTEKGSSPENAGALMTVRRTVFEPAEIAAFNLLGTTARLTMENAELSRSRAAQETDLSQLLEISAEVGNASNLDVFMRQFLVKMADFLKFERTFVAVYETGECRVRWSASKGVASNLDLDISAMARRVFESRSHIIAENPAQFPVPEKTQLSKLDGQIRQYLSVPLISGNGSPLGILTLLNKKSQEPVTQEEVRRAKVLAATAAMAMEAARNLEVSDQYKKRAEDLMETALDLGTALRLPDLVRTFTERVAGMIGAQSAILALVQGNTLESVGFFGPKPERDLLRKFDAALTQYVERYSERISGSRISDSRASEPRASEQRINSQGVQALGREVAAAMGWQNVTLVRLEGSEPELLGILALANTSRELLPNDLNLLQALVVHGSVALENSRLFTRITQSSRQWAEIFDSISDFIVVHDERHEVLKINRSLADFIGVRPAELIGLNMRALVPITTDSSHPCPFCRDKADADEYLHPVLERSYLVSTSRIHGALDEGLQTIHVLKDITDRREAERRYRELFDNVQEGVFFSSPEGHFIEVNDALVRMLGYQSRDEVLKLDLKTQVYISSEQRDEIARRLSESGSVQNFEVTLCRRDGTMIHALENAFVVRDTQNNVLQYRGVFLDITEVKNFQGQLQRERDFTSKILNNTQTMIVVADTAGLVSYANRRCYEAGAFEQNELVGRRLDRIVSPSHQEMFKEGFDSALHGMQVDNLELMIARGNGSQGKFSVNLSPMRDEAGEVTSVVVLMTDITDAAMIQAKLMHTEKMAAVGQLVSGVAHEVNNPLTAIMGFSDLLMENPEVPGSARKDLQVILEEAQRTKEIVQNLLSFARQRPPQRQRVQLNDILRKTIALRAYDFANHGVQIVERFDEGLPELTGDSHQLQQVFLNILNNAYDAVHVTGRPGMIEIETVQDLGWLEVLFRDNGEGIRNPERIFDPFFTTKEVGQGTGLGLSICYGIVREHEGEIMCANNQDTPGATFSVRLPVRTRSDLHIVTAAGAQP
jgi:PAS domain S-box-containing protein